MKTSTLSDLAASFRGELIEPADPGYEAARRVWNGMIDKRPALIARCSGIADVVAALRFARGREAQIAVRGGGHNVAGNAVCDDGVVIDLSGLKGIHVDPKARTVRAQGGVTLGDLDHETQAFGLAVPAGVVSTTGIAGLTLGGGLGWLARKHGTTADNLLAAEVVTADGDVVTASAEENADLFWGLRGGGGNFGIVTWFEYRAHPVDVVLAGPVFHPLDAAADVLRFYREFAARAPDELTLIAAILTAPSAPFLPEEAHGRPAVALATCYVGDHDRGEEALRPLRSFGKPLADAVGPMPFVALQTMFDGNYPPGLSNYWKSSFLHELSDEAIDVVVDHAARMTSPLSSIYFEHLQGAIAGVDEDETAFGHRRVAFDFSALALWAQGEAKPHVAWARDLWTALQPYAAGGVYVNNLGAEGEDRVRAAYGPEKYERLVALKNKYDPANVFRLNQNIRLTAAVPV